MELLSRTCRICDGDIFITVLDMGVQPLVNSLLAEASHVTISFPLEIVQCQDCFLVQVFEPINEDLIYVKQDYLYFSGDMPGLSDYFKEYAKQLMNRFVEPRDFVVEIGSNDGTMLKFFNYPKLGVDPSTNVVVRAIRNGVPTLSAPFSKHLGETIAKELGEAKLVYANNCMAHIDDLDSVMGGVTSLLRSDGVFVVECNYWPSMVKNGNYALVYHDHFSYFSVLDWQHIAKKHDLTVFDATITPAQGGSLRVFLSKDEREKTPEFLKLVKKEQADKIASPMTAEKYNKAVKDKAEKLKKKVLELKNKDLTIAGYGAAAKGFSLLSLAGIRNEIDFFVDDSPAKQGKFTAVHKIPIVARHEREDPDVFLITAPNYTDIIIKKEKAFLDRGGRFLLEDGTIYEKEQ